MTSLQTHHATRLRTYRLVLLDRAGGVRLAETLAFRETPEEGELLQYEDRDWRVLELDGDELLVEPA